MVWDPNLPDEDQDIAQGPIDIKANNAALETGIGAEHRFADGGNQSGTHTFNTDTTANLDLLSDSAEGRIGFSTDEISGKHVLMFHDGADFEPADVNPGNVPRTDSTNVFEKPNWTDEYDATGDLVSGSPDTLTIDLANATFQSVTLTNDTLIDGVTNDQSGKLTTILLEITQGGAGGHAVTWDTPATFVAPNGVGPIIEGTAGYLSLVQMTKNSAGTWIVTSLPKLAGF